MRISDMPENLTEEEARHIAGRRTADELTAHILGELDKKIDSLVIQAVANEKALTDIRLKMAEDRGDNKSVVQRVEKLEKWCQDVTKHIVSFWIAIAIAVALAVLKGAGMRLG